MQWGSRGSRPRREPRYASSVAEDSQSRPHGPSERICVVHSIHGLREKDYPYTDRLARRAERSLFAVRLTSKLCTCTPTVENAVPLKAPVGINECCGDFATDVGVGCAKCRTQERTEGRSSKLLLVVHLNAHDLVALRVDSTRCDRAGLAVSRHFNAATSSALTVFLRVETQRAVIDLRVRSLV